MSFNMRLALVALALALFVASSADARRHDLRHISATLASPSSTWTPANSSGHAEEGYTSLM